MYTSKTREIAVDWLGLVLASPADDAENVGQIKNGRVMSHVPTHNHPGRLGRQGKRRRGLRGVLVGRCCSPRVCCRGEIWLQPCVRPAFGANYYWMLVSCCPLPVLLLFFFYSFDCVQHKVHVAESTLSDCEAPARFSFFVEALVAFDLRLCVQIHVTPASSC